MEGPPVWLHSVPISSSAWFFQLLFPFGGGLEKSCSRNRTSDWQITKQSPEHSFLLVQITLLLIERASAQN